MEQVPHDTRLAFGAKSSNNASLQVLLLGLEDVIKAVILDSTMDLMLSADNMLEFRQEASSEVKSFENSSNLAGEAVKLAWAGLGIGEFPGCSNSASASFEPGLLMPDSPMLASRFFCDRIPVVVAELDFVGELIS